jgi:ribose-phosphate pyrophosphokinase
MERGAKSVVCAATHAVFSGPAVERLDQSVMEQVIVTDTLPLPPEKRFDKLEVLSVAPIIAETIRAVFEDSSVSQIFDGHNQN